MQCLVTGLWQSPLSVQAGWYKDGAQPGRKGLGGSGGWQTGHEPAVCPCGLEIQPYPELLPKKCCQQGEGGDSAPQLCAVRPHVLHPDVESSVQDRHGPVKAFPEEDHKIDPRDGRL